jgi:hypothetical protein
MSLGNRQKQVALLGTFLSMQIDETLPATQPAARAPGFSVREQTKAQPERGSCRGQILTRIETRVIEALLCRQHLLIPCRQSGRPGKPVQVVGSERSRPVRERQRFESIVPFIAVETRAPAFEVCRGPGFATLGIGITGFAWRHRRRPVIHGARWIASGRSGSFIHDCANRASRWTFAGPRRRSAYGRQAETATPS